MDSPISSGLTASLSCLSASDRAELDRLLTTGAPRWLPLPGPQAQAYETPADVLFYGGAAGGGKTDLLIGLALTRHRRSVLFRREHKQLAAIVERMAAILGTRQGYNGQDGTWRLAGPGSPAGAGTGSPAGAGGRLIRLGGCQHPGDETAWQGQPHDLVGFDEVTQFQEAQFRFLCGWNRTTVAGQRCRVVATGNPPTTAEGAWVIRFWAPWLDPAHANPARPGELRWFATLGGEDREVAGPEPFQHLGETIRPLSRTFIPSRVEDNPYLMATGYRATLQALPEPLRSQMLKGDFGAGREDDPWQVIPTAWTVAAQGRWTAKPPAGQPMDALGVDVARGGRDATVLIARHGDWFGQPVALKGEATPDGPAVAAQVVKVLRDGAPVQIDVIGVGASVYDHLKGNGIEVTAMNGAEASHARDRSGRLGFANKRAEWWWGLREALDPDYGDSLALPPDRALVADLAAPRWKLTPRGIQVEAKEETIRRLGRSPDLGDACVYALAATAKTRRDRMRRRPEGADGAYAIHRW